MAQNPSRVPTTAERLLQASERALLLVTYAGLVIMIVAALLGIADRAFLKMGIAWAEEIARFSLVWTSLLSAALVVRTRQHFQLTFLHDRLGVNGRRVLHALVLVTLLTAFWFGVELTMVFSAMTSPALGLSMGWVYAAVPAFALISAIYIAYEMVVPPPVAAAELDVSL